MKKINTIAVIGSGSDGRAVASEYYGSNLVIGKVLLTYCQLYTTSADLSDFSKPLHLYFTSFHWYGSTEKGLGFQYAYFLFPGFATPRQQLAIFKSQVNLLQFTHAWILFYMMKRKLKFFWR